MEKRKAYYRSSDVRARIREFIGATTNHGASCEFLAASDENASPPFQRYSPDTIDSLLDAGVEVSRSLWDDNALIADYESATAGTEGAVKPFSFIPVTRFKTRLGFENTRVDHPMLKAWQFRRRKSSPVWRRVVVFFIGGVILIIGLVMLVLPGPALIFIPLGLAILATEFRWARKWLLLARQRLRGRFQKIRLKRAK